MTGAKNMRKRLTLKEKVALIEDSMQPGFKQSKAAMKWGISPGCVNSILKNKTKIFDDFQNDAKNKNSKKNVSSCKFSEIASKLFEWHEEKS